MPWMKRLAAMALTALVLISLLGVAMAEQTDNLLYNGSFEKLDGDGLPDGWYTEQWFTQAGYTVYSMSDDAQDGSRSAVIANLGSNDARFAQSVDVEPESLYCLSGWIKTGEVSDAGWGANLSVSGVYCSTEGVYGTEDAWQYVEMYGETGEDQRLLTVYVRLGGYSGESEGSAQFDNICLRKVDALPEDVVANLWFRPTVQYVDTDDDDTASPAVPAPFWPWLIALTALYCGFAYLLMRIKPGVKDLRGGKRAPALLIVGLVLAFVLRYYVALQVDGYQVDVNCFLSWGNTMASVGPGAFYQATSFCDYPPAYVYVMGLCSLLSTLIRTAFGGVTPHWLRPEIVLKLVPMLADIAIAWCIYCIAKRRGSDRRRASAIALLTAFNPVLIINSAAWCQIDSVLGLLLLLVAWLAVERRWMALMPVYMLAVLVKPQALMLGFLGLTAIVMTWVKHKEDRKPMLIGAALALLMALIVIVPFSTQQLLVTKTAEDGTVSTSFWLIDKYAETLSSYAYATVNTANLYYLVGGNWNGIANQAHWAVPVVLALICLGWGFALLRTLEKRGARAFWVEPVLMSAFTLFFAVCGVLHLSWTVVGYGAMALAFAIILPMYIRAGKLEHLPLLGGVLFLLLYVLGIKMHERYLFPAIALLAMAWCLRPDRRTMALLLGCTATMFLNEGIVLDNAVRLGASMGHLNNDTYALNIALSCANVLLVPLGLWTCASVCLGEGTIPEWLHIELPRSERQQAQLESYRPDPSLHWRRLDTVLVLVITAVYAVAGYWHLGSAKAPQTVWNSSTAAEQVVLDLGKHYDDFTMLYYAQISYNDFQVEVSEDGETWSEPYWAQMAQGQCFRWQYLVPCYTSDSRSYATPSVYADVQRLSGRYVRINAMQIGLKLCEVIFRQSIVGQDEYGLTYTGGEIIPVTVVSRTGGSEVSPNYSDPANLVDEQDTLEGEPCWFNGTYFDEIYHARTAFEHLHGEHAYETTHPPLGKVLMSWGAAIFGMTPFGWRFMGVLAGVLMLPGMYLLAKQLTKRTSLGAAAAILMALDSMHYAQTRIATIDSFPVLFIIWAFLFMVRFMQRDVVTSELKQVLPDLALSGFFMGCAIASKWIGIYAGAGLAVLYFWTCLRHVRMSAEAARQLARGAAEQTNHDVLKKRAEGTWERIITLCLWCLLFFVAVPLVIYLLSYIPFIAPKHPSGLLDYLRKVWDAQTAMLSYHGTPGLGMDHPFYSPWYEWPFNAKPMYYAMAYFAPEGTSFSIFCFTNPAVTLPALAALIVVAFVWAKRHVYSVPGSQSLLQLRSHSWDIAPAFVLIGLLAQYLPWVLVPRGTYIYHYFASLPFLILATVMAFHWAMKRWPKGSRVALAVYLLVCLGFFVVLYPYASGEAVPTAWLELGRKLLKVYYR